MGILYITEFSTQGSNGYGRATPYVQQPPLAEQVVTYSTTTASNAFSANTQIVRLHTDSICSVEFGTSPTATTSTSRMAAGSTEYFSVPQGKSFKVAAITNT